MSFFAAHDPGVHLMRMSTIFAVSGALAALALSAVNAEVPVPKPVTPKVTVHTPAPPKYNNPPLNHPMKQPGGKGFAPITLNRGVTSDRSLQQWEQGIGGSQNAAQKLTGRAKASLQHQQNLIDFMQPSPYNPFSK